MPVRGGARGADGRGGRGRVQHLHRGLLRAQALEVAVVHPRHREDPLVDRHRRARGRPRAGRSTASDSFCHGAAVGRNSTSSGSAGTTVQRVAGVQVRAVDQVGVVRRSRGMSGWITACCPPSTSTRAPATCSVAPGSTVSWSTLAQLPRRPAVDDQPRVRVRPQQGGQALGVEVVRVLVGDQHGVQAGHVLEARREVARVDQQPGRTGVEQHARVSEVGDLHGPTLPPP